MAVVVFAISVLMVAVRVIFVVLVVVPAVTVRVRLRLRARVLAVAVLVVAVRVVLAVFAGSVAVAVRLLLLSLVRKQLRVHLLNHAVQGESAHAHHVLCADSRFLRLLNLSHAVDSPNAACHLRQLRLIHQIRLVEHDAVGEGNLLHSLVHNAVLLHLVEVAGHVLGVHHCDQSVQAVLLRELVVQEERLDDGRRVGESGGLDEHVVEFVALVHGQVAEHVHQIPAHGAAKATVVEHQHVLLPSQLSCNERSVNIDLTKLIFYDCYTHAMVVLQDPV
mmetsp:Transcript_3969/g.7732  ORF Transcript_3969/g.7732 Transcript_3969/m.7732 type:complete len:277 (+) Transcript_3969:1293-2123(+)